MDLFEPPGQAAPLAARMRPQTLDEFVGQEHLVGPGRVLRRLVESGQLASVVLYGPPGTGKTTLARILARSARAHFETLNAVTSGASDIRRVAQEALDRLRFHGQRTVVFVDEIHRFNRAQQDLLLPHVEDGTFFLVGATTENPFFALASTLVSRVRILRLEPLSPEHVSRIVQRAVQDPNRGLGRLGVQVAPDALDHLVRACGGDARVALNALELAAATTPPGEDGVRRVDLRAVEEALQHPVLRYDRAGDQHYDTTSAFIKSLRGSDPDAALYWMVRMLEAGEDPRFVARRMVVHAAEDVGLADPQALVVATAAAAAVEYVGMPEAQIPLAEAALYIACAPKSNAVVRALARVREDVRTRTPEPVPPHLRDSSYPGAAALGHGQGYRYPHDDPRGFVEQDYLPQGLLDRVYYEPSQHGFEAEIRRRLEALRGYRLQGKRG